MEDSNLSFIMAFAHGFVFHVYHPPTGLHYLSAAGTKIILASTTLWSSWFPKHPTIRALIKIYGADTFEATLLREYKTRNEAVHLVRRWNRRFKPHLRGDWIVEKTIPLHAHGLRKKGKYQSRKGVNNPHYGRRLSPSQKARRIQNIKAKHKQDPFRICTTDQGKERRVPLNFVLPKGWRWGFNMKNRSRWSSLKGRKRSPEAIQNSKDALRMWWAKQKAERARQAVQASNNG